MPTIDYTYSSPNYWTDSTQIEGFCLHGTADKTAGVMNSVNWLCSPNSGASVNYIVGKQGQIYCIVDPYKGKRAWGNGIPQSPDMSVPWVAKNLNAGVNLNKVSISIEHEQLDTDMQAHNYTAFTQAQKAASMWLVNKLCADFKLAKTRQVIIGHYQIEKYDRANCPGVIDLDAYVKELNAMSQPDVTDPNSGATSWHCLPTDKWVTDEQGFLTYWRTNGGMNDFGYPISGAAYDSRYKDAKGNALIVQWFERARFEYHPENDNPYKVLLGLVGKELLAKL